MKEDNPALQHWDCDKCSQTYRSPVALSFPPLHACPSLKSRVRREFKLKAVRVLSEERIFSIQKGVNQAHAGKVTPLDAVLAELDP